MTRQVTPKKAKAPARTYSPDPKALARRVGDARMQAQHDRDPEAADYFRYDPVAAGEVREMIRQINRTLDEVEEKLRAL